MNYLLASFLGALLALLLVNLLEVELKLATLQNVAIGAAALAGARGNYSIQTTGGELLLEGRLDGARLVALGELALEVIALLLGALGSGISSGLSAVGGGLLLLLGGSLGLLGAKSDTVVLLVPLTEGGGIDLDDGVLHKSVGAHQLVVRGVINYTKKTGLASDS